MINKYEKKKKKIPKYIKKNEQRTYLNLMDLPNKLLKCM